MSFSSTSEAKPPIPRGTDSEGSFSTNRPVAILMLFLAAVVFGYFSYERLPLTLMPELTYPTVTVRTEYPGSAPEEVENDISRPIEEALGVIGGLQRISSVSRAGVSDVVLEFGWDIEISQATQDILERLDLVFLPDEASRPLILHFDPSLDPVMELSVTGTGEEYEGEDGLRRLRRLADLMVKRAIEPIKGIAAVRIKGGLEEEIHVLLEEAQLSRTGISIQQVIRRLGQENINVAGGTIQEGRTEYLVRTLNEFEDLSQIGETIVANFEGREVRVNDIGQVVTAHKERQIITRTDGGESVQIEVFKEADANIVSLAARVTALVGELTPEMMEAIDSRESKNGGGSGDMNSLSARLYREEKAKLAVVADRSLFIESSIREVKKTALIGGLLAIVILFLFLRVFKSTVIVAVSIPVSILMTFAPLHLLQVTLNIMSLGGLALGIGMLVDSSIVVLESIHRCREEGDSLIAAAIRGTNEVRTAVVASTLTSIAVFLPMVFVEGVAGQAFGDLGLAVVVSLLASVVVALYLIPMLASRRGFQMQSLQERASGADAPSGFRGLLRFGSWGRMLDDLRSMPTWAYFILLIPPLYHIVRFWIGVLLEVLGKIILAIFMLLGLIYHWALAPIAIFLFRIIFWAPLRVTDWVMARIQGAYPKILRWALSRQVLIVVVVVACLIGSWQLVQVLDSELLPEVRQGEFTFEITLPVGTPLQETNAILAPIEEAILAEAENLHAVIVTVGYDPTQSEQSDEGEHTARFKILTERSERGSEDDTVERLRKRFVGIPDLDARVVRPVLFSSKTPIEVEIHGDDLRLLRKYADEARTVMAGLPELADVQTTLLPGAPEVQVVYDRDRLSRYGLNIGEVARLVRDKVKGYEATRFNMINRRIPIVVRLSEGDRETVEDVETIVVNPGGERPISMASVAQVSLGEGPSEVRRVDGRRVAVIRANIASGSLSAASGAIERVLSSRIDWPSGMAFYLSGQNEEWDRSRNSLLLALGLSIFLVYVIMAAQFESLVHPLVIMFTIPLAFIGTVLALLALQIPLSVVVFLGMIMLAGIVVNNAIVLVDYINRLRRRGMERTEAIVTAGTVRLRPILMTTATTVLGLTPMAMGFGDGAEIRTPMAIAVISGLITSTVLTLLIIPTIYAIADGLASRVVRVREGRAERGKGQLSGPAPDGATP